MKTYVATKNDGKLAELREIFAESPFELAIYPAYGDVEEPEDNYPGNALIKARALFAQLQAEGIHGAVLSDDSGIEVAALNGRPGVLSARYAPGVSWPERLKTLLGEVGDAAGDRRAVKFVCAMALLLPDGRALEGYGEVHGQLTQAPAGSNGFGYDPVFFYPPIGKTFGEIPEAEKNRLSHRFAAAQALLSAYQR
ncbi:MAG: non-canonical purine NTP pyrophosphatase [Candidatus Eremiobacteraeota bacterium]|nr:non-canonical purine NTP pyrophosphatase [Candidatus Eremiobacteraeota bacterium]